MTKVLNTSFVIIFLGLLTISNTFGQVRTIADRTDIPKLRKTTADFQKANQLPGISVVIVRNGSMIFKHGEGFAQKGVKADGDTVYNAASISKIIAGTIAVKLVQNDKLEDGTRIKLGDVPDNYPISSLTHCFN